MSVRMTFTCDRCNDPVDSRGLALAITDLELDSKVAPMEYEDVHLCEGCEFEFKHFMERYRKDG